MSNTMLFWILIFSVPIVAIVFGTIERIFRYRAMERLAEKGHSLPPEIYDHGSRYYRRYYRTWGGRLARGIWLICVGIALAVFFWVMTGMHPIGPDEVGGNGWLPVIGIFPFMLGVAQILIAIFERSPSQDSKE